MNPPNTALWREILAQVPGGTSAAGVAVAPLAGGTTNATFRVQTRQGAFVIRMHEPYTLDLGVDRKREAMLHAAAAHAGLASRILAADPAGRYLVTEFLNGAGWRPVDLQDGPRRRLLAQTLLALHTAPVPVVAPLDLQALLARHVAQIAVQNPSAAQDLAPQLARAREILIRQAEVGRPACIVHGDLSLANIIGSDRPQFIDWEYACVGDPLADLACLAAYYPQVLTYGTALLRDCGLAASAGLPALQELTWVYRLLSDLWYQRLELARRHPPPAH